MRKSLSLRKETLAELSVDELSSVVGGTSILCSDNSCICEITKLINTRAVIGQNGW